MGHTLARELIQFDVNRQDKSIIHSWSMLDQMEKNLNTFVMRLKEWYGWHFPELVKSVADNETYTRVCYFIGNKDNLTDESIEGLEEIVKDGEVAQRILDSSRNSVGNDLTEVDELSLKSFCEYLVSHFDFKNSLQGFMREKMENVAPNFTALIGENVVLTHPSWVPSS
jgi:nucleolar protein 56